MPKLQLINKDESGATYQMGNSICNVIAPSITDGEREQRLKEIQRVAWYVWDEMCNQKRLQAEVSK